MALEFPDDAAAAATPGDQYMFGSELLVAPVLYEGQSNRKVYFPAGTWVDWDMGYDYAGGREWVVSAPQNRIPVAVREGAIIPMAPDMRNTSEKPWDPLTLEVFPAGKSDFTMYHDDGKSFAYEGGDFTTTKFDSDLSGGTLRFSVNESNKKYTPTRYVARFHLRRTPVSVTIDNADAKGAWTWDAEARVLTVPFIDGLATTHELEVKLDDVVLPARIAPTLTAQIIDPKGEAAGSGGKPIPHFFPAPALPAIVKAANYDNGGEGIAFHITRSAPEKPTYRQDDIGLATTSDAGGGYALTGLKAGEWVRYSIDCGNGGYFDMNVRAASHGGGKVRFVALDQTVATVDIPATGGGDTFSNVIVHGIYLNPGVLSMMVFVEEPGFALNTFGFTSTDQHPAVFPAALAFRSGVVGIAGVGQPKQPLGYVVNLGRKGSSLLFSMDGGKGGLMKLRLHYQNGRGIPIHLALTIDQLPPISLLMADTAGAWKDLDVPVTMIAGPNRVLLEGKEEDWNSIQIDTIQVAP
jgi:hypothetical protein